LGEQVGVRVEGTRGGTNRKSSVSGMRVANRSPMERSSPYPRASGKCGGQSVEGDKMKGKTWKSAHFRTALGGKLKGINGGKKI